jgi:hypothetical protein
MVGLGLVECWVLVDFGCRGETCELYLVWLQGCDLQDLFGCGYRVKTCEPVALGYSWVTEVQCHA